MNSRGVFNFLFKESIPPHHRKIRHSISVSTGHYDPTRPAQGWRTALREMLAVAGIKVSAYSFRHHAITKLLENLDVSEETAEAIGGHISHQIKKRIATLAWK